MGAALGDQRQPLAAAFGKHDHRDRAPRGFARQARHDALHVLERELFVSRGAQAAAPGVEDLHRVNAGGDLRAEVVGDRIGEHAEQFVHQRRLIVSHGFDA